jgi:integrase
VARHARETGLKERWNDAVPEVQALLYRDRYRRLYELLTSGRVVVRVVPKDRVFIHGKAGMTNCNLRTQLLRLMARAGLEPWPKPFHNLRASCESDLANDFPLAMVARWLGNTPSVALRHYVDPTDEAFRRAAQWSPNQGGVGGATSNALAVKNSHPQDSANKR